MAEVEELSDAEKNFLQSYLPPASSNLNVRATGEDVPLALGEAKLSSGHPSSRPFVTLTYACSLDSMVSLAPGLRTTLSGPQTKSMSHYLRLQHDSILVGVGTAIADDPSLNCRYPGARLGVQPQPVVIDPRLRWDVASAKVKQLAHEGKGKPPWIIQTAKIPTPEPHSASGYELVFVDDHGLSPSLLSTEPKLTYAPRKIEWNGILNALKKKGINSVMIEGGATIINELLSRPNLVDTVIITIAPTWLGQGGTTVSPQPRTENGQRINAANLKETIWQQFGQDVVLCGRLCR